MKNILFILATIITSIATCGCGNNSVAGNSQQLGTDLCLDKSPHFRNIAITPDGSKAFVTGDGIGGVFVIGTESNSIIAKIPLKMDTDAVAVSPDGKMAYVTSANNGVNISVIDIPSFSVTATFPIEKAPIQAKGLTLSKSGNDIYVSIGDYGADRILVINSRTGVISKNIPVKDSGETFSVTPDGTKAFLGGKGITEINLIKQEIVATIPSSDFDERFAISPDGSKLVVGRTGSPASIKIIDVKTRAILESISLGSDVITTQNQSGLIFPEGIVFIPKTEKIYVSNHMTRPGKISVVDLRKHEVINTINFGEFPGDLVVTPNGTRAYALSSNKDALIIGVINTQTDQVIKEILWNEAPPNPKSCH